MLSNTQFLSEMTIYASHVRDLPVQLPPDYLVDKPGYQGHTLLHRPLRNDIAYVRPAKSLQSIKEVASRHIYCRKLARQETDLACVGAQGSLTSVARTLLSRISVLVRRFCSAAGQLTQSCHAETISWTSGRPQSVASVRRSRGVWSPAKPSK